MGGALQTRALRIAKPVLGPKGGCLRRRYLGQNESEFTWLKYLIPALAVMRHGRSCERRYIQQAARGDGRGDDMGAVAHAHQNGANL